MGSVEVGFLLVNKLKSIKTVDYINLNPQNKNAPQAETWRAFFSHTTTYFFNTATAPPDGAKVSVKVSLLVCFASDLLRVEIVFPSCQICAL